MSTARVDRSKGGKISVSLRTIKRMVLHSRLVACPHRHSVLTLRMHLTSEHWEYW